jgi:tRNA A-37 threonylcarbamoyl transferase component Bud32
MAIETGKAAMASTRIILEPGETLGGYRVSAVIGVGGMAIVYEAEQISLGRPVALKVLSAKLSHDEAFRERFRREGKNVAALDHPHIVSVYDSGEADGRLFLAMRLVQGATLADRIREGGLSADETLRILGPIADALDTAHAAGVVHRDVKPQNILLTEEGHPYLADFGVATGLHTAGLTATGGFVGSFSYAAPEQFLGKHATAATDVYALAAVVFQCLTGELPYPRDTDGGVLIAYVNQSPAAGGTGLPRANALNEIIARGMANDPNRRYKRAGSLLAATAAVVDNLNEKQRRAVPAFAVSLAPDLETGSGVAHHGAGLTPSLERPASCFAGSVAPSVETVGQLRIARTTAELAGLAEPAEPDAQDAQDAHSETVPPVEELKAKSRRRRDITIAVGTVAGAIVALVVLLAGTGATAVARTRTARSGPLAIAYRAPWRSVAGAVAGSVALHAPIRLASGTATVSGGTLRESAAVPGAVPPELRVRYGPPASEASLRVAGSPGRRYSWTLRGDRQLVAFVIPTTGADVAIVCDVKRSAARLASSCADLAMAARVSGVHLLSPGPVTPLVSALKRDLTPVLASRDRLGGLDANSLPDRASAARTIGDVERSAAARLSALGVPARYRPLISALIDAINREAGAFVSLSVAAASGQEREYARMSAAVASASDKLSEAARGVRVGGLGIPPFARLTLPAPPAAPVSTYPAPAQTYTAPAQTYTAPAQTYTAPVPTYIAPAQTYTAPVPTYTPPPPQPVGRGSGRG